MASINTIQDPDVLDSSIVLSGIDGDIGFFPEYVPKAETVLNMQMICRDDGGTSQVFADEQGDSLFTLDRGSGPLSDKELRDMRRMFVFGMHKRRFHLPRQ